MSVASWKCLHVVWIEGGLVNCMARIMNEALHLGCARPSVHGTQRCFPLLLVKRIRNSHCAPVGKMAHTSQSDACTLSSGGTLCSQLQHLTLTHASIEFPEMHSVLTCRGITYSYAMDVRIPPPCNTLARLQGKTPMTAGSRHTFQQLLPVCEAI